MGKDKHRSSSRSRERRHRRNSGSEGEEERSRRTYKGSHKYRSKSEEERSDDEYKEEKKERRKHQKDLKRRGKEGKEEDTERARGGQGDASGGFGVQKYGDRGGNYTTSAFGPQEYRPLGYEGSLHQAPPFQVPQPGGDRFGGYAPHQPPPPPQAYPPAPQGYPPPPQAYPPAPQGYPPAPQGYPPPPQAYPPAPQGYPPPPPPPPQAYGQAPQNSYGAGGGAFFDGQAPPPQHGGPHGYHSSPPPQPYQPNFQAYDGRSQGSYQQPQSPLQPQEGFQPFQQPPPSLPPAQGGSYRPGEYRPQGTPPGVVPPSTYGAIAGGGDALGFASRPQYSTASAPSGKYKPQEHSTAQEQGIGARATYFSETSQQPPSGVNVLDTFTKGLSSSLHNYARNLFPASSTYSADPPSGKVAASEAKTDNRFDSFAPVRNGNGAKWYVDGKDYMFAVSLALEKARQTIWILDWWLSPELYLRRPPKLNKQYRLDRMLQAAAARGVRINVIVYKEVPQALTLDSQHTKHALEALHPNISVFRHPDHLPDRDNVIRDSLKRIKAGSYQLGDGLKGIYSFKDDITLFYAHHEKLCVIDGEVAFMGGLDLCFGRFDTNEHPIADAHPSDLNAIIFPGQDYNNARYLDFQHVDKPEENAVSRLEFSRMGWSDVAMSLIGPAVEDLKIHFIQRWNFIYKSKYDARQVNRLGYAPLDESAFKGGHGYHRRHLKEKVKHHSREGDYGYQEQQDHGSPPEPEGVRLQICRSVSKWSHGTETEHSIANAYREIISTARHFVYIENQFFITATDHSQKPILNMIGRAIVDRIIRAHNRAERFRIIVVIPAVPGFAGDLQGDAALGTRAIIEFQQRSINRDRGFSIMEQIHKAGIDPREYINFYNLRSYDRINFAGAKVGKEASGVGSEHAARVHDEAVGGGIGYGQHGTGEYGSAIKGGEYQRYQQHAPSSGIGGQWDSVAKCVMLGGGDIRHAPWDGSPDEEIEAFVSEELYVHSKLLIADDRIVLMGSANLNDRSQLGDHDSEIACIIDDPTPLPSRMNGGRFTASHFAATLRRQIFRKHLGLIPAQNFGSVDENMQPIPVPNIYDFDSPEDRLVEDPLSDEFWNFWNQTAKVNTDVFAKVFHAIPHDSIHNWRQYEEYWSKYFAVPKGIVKKEGMPEPQPAEKWGHVVKSEFSPGAQGAREVKEILSAVRGMLVEMPLNFLKDEDVAKEGLGLNAFTEALYT